MKVMSINFKERRHGIFLPGSIRAIIYGPSNCEKINLLMNLLYNENGLAFQNIYLYSKLPNKFTRLKG